MEKQGRYLKVKTRDGRVLMSLFLNLGQGIILEGQLDREGRDKQYPPKNGGNGKHGGNGGTDNGSSMTYPQKRLLFRLMAQEGFEGDAARDELLKLFGNDSLEDVSKSDASRMIERLLKEAKEGGAGNGIPF